MHLICTLLRLSSLSFTLTQVTLRVNLILYWSVYVLHISISQKRGFACVSIDNTHIRMLIKKNVEILCFLRGVNFTYLDSQQSSDLKSLDSRSPQRDIIQRK